MSPIDDLLVIDNAKVRYCMVSGEWGHPRTRESMLEVSGDLLM